MPVGQTHQPIPNGIECRHCTEHIGPLTYDQGWSCFREPPNRQATMLTL